MQPSDETPQSVDADDGTVAALVLAASAPRASPPTPRTDVTAPADWSGCNAGFLWATENCMKMKGDFIVFK